MSVDVDSVAGYGVEITEGEFHIIFKKEMAELIKNDEDLDEDSEILDIWEYIEFDEELLYSLESGGSRYSEIYNYYLIISDMTIDGIEERCEIMRQDLIKKGLEDPKIIYINDTLWC